MELADYIVADLRLLMVGKIKILNKIVFEEQHKRKPITQNIKEDTVIDLSHTIENGPVTYIDFLFHKFENNKDLCQISLERFIDIDAVVIKIPFTETLEITEEHLKHYEIRNRAVLIHTGWDIHWDTEYYNKNPPYLTINASEYLKDCNVKLVGIDSYGIDHALTMNRPVYTTFPGEEIFIVENLCNLNLLPQEGFKFSAVPPKFKKAKIFPVRAMAKF